MSYICIHNHTHIGSNLRFKDSIIKPDELIQYAHELGHIGVIISDHESIAAHMTCLDYYDTIKNNSEYEGFVIGYGNEIYLCPESVTAENIKTNIYPHFILIACDAEGHKGIRELSTKAWTQNSFMHVHTRVPTYYSDLEEMMQKYKGHIIGSSACLGGSLPRHILEYKENNSQNTWDECIYWINYIKDIFGEGMFFLELQPGLTEEQIYVNQQLVKLSEITGVDYLISCDSHYLRKEDKEIHKVFINSNETDRETDTFYESTYLMSEKEIHERMDSYLGFDTVQTGIDNTILIYDKLTYYDLRKPLHIPYIPLNTDEPDKDLYEKYVPYVPLYKDLYESKYDCDRHLLRRLLEYMEEDPYYRREEAYYKVNEALDYLLRSSDKMNVRWSAYLLQVSDYVDIAWKAGTLVGPGRGSCIGFCLNFMLRITQVDPLRETSQTYPWRFLNPDRASVLDIDCDIEGSARDVVIQALKDTYGEDRVSKVLTFQSEKTKSAILSAGRSLGYDNDLTSYLASLIIFDRGAARSLHTMYYGDDDNAPVSEFVREMDNYPDIWEAAQKIEGLCSGCGSHAGGVIICDTPLTDTVALMKTNGGDIVTQFDLHMAEAASLIKIDLLSIDALDKIHATLNLLLDAGKIEWQGNLKDTYFKYLDLYKIERNDPSMWQMLWNHQIPSFFQMEKQSGIQGVGLIKPKSVDELAIVNSMIRLMPQSPDAEIPLQKYARFHEDITNWYKEMDDYGLTQEEQDILKPLLTISSGLCESQERFMQLVQIPECGGFSLSFADTLRKAVAKKNPKAYLELEQQYFKETAEKGLSKNLTNYVWNCLIAVSRGYSFNLSHCLAYSLIGLQEMYLAWAYGVLYWSTGCIEVDSGSYDTEANDSTNYAKLGVATAKMQSEGVHVANPTINEVGFGFQPDESNNQIVFALKAICGINTELAQIILQNRPYTSMDDFATRMLDTKIIKNIQMIMLIKAGCFLNLHSQDRAETMKWYLKRYKYTPIDKLTLSQMGDIQEYDIVPNELKICIRIINFKKYVLDDEGLYDTIIIPDKKIPQRGYHDRLFILDNPAMEFFKEQFSENSIEKIVNANYVISEKKFIKEVDKLIQPLKDWFASDEAVSSYNKAQYKSIWNKYAFGNEAHWSMQALTYYDQDHELKGTNEEIYGIKNFFELPEQPVTYDHYYKMIDGERKQFDKYTIVRIAGTVLDKNDIHHTVTILSQYGVVPVKFARGQFIFYDKQLSKLNEFTGKKETFEKSWFSRGSLIVIAGIRSEDTFIAKTYQDTIYKHSCERILEVHPDGTLLLQAERAKV